MGFHVLVLYMLLHSLQTYSSPQLANMPTTPDLNEADVLQVPLAREGTMIDKRCSDCKLKIPEFAEKGHIERNSQETLKHEEMISKNTPCDIDKSVLANRKHSREQRKNCKMCTKRIILTFVALDILVLNLMLIWMYFIPLDKNSQRSKAIGHTASKANMLLHINRNATISAHDSTVHWTVHSTSCNTQNRSIEYKGNKLIVHQDGAYAIILDLSLKTNLGINSKRDVVQDININICLKASKIHIACDRKIVKVGWMGKARIHLVGKQLSKGTELAVTIDQRVKMFIRGGPDESSFYIVQL